MDSNKTPEMPPDLPHAGQPEQGAVTGRKRRWPCIAAVLSFAIPGLGHLYAGRPRLAVFFYLISFFFPLALLAAGFQYSFRGLVAMVLLELGLTAVIMLHAALTASREGTALVRPYQRWYVYGIVLVCAFGVSALSEFTLQRGPLDMHPFKIPSESMEPTLLVGDHLIAARRPFSEKGPKRGEIVVFRHPRDTERHFIKRVVALGGDTVALREGRLFINSKPVIEPYAVYDGPPGANGKLDNFGPISVPADSVFVMGDNRNHSFDSRQWGPLKLELITGKALYIYWSWNAMLSAPRVSRMGMVIE